jgi:hypothetical protein
MEGIKALTYCGAKKRIIIKHTPNSLSSMNLVETGEVG